MFEFFSNVKIYVLYFFSNAQRNNIGLVGKVPMVVLPISDLVEFHSMWLFLVIFRDLKSVILGQVFVLTRKKVPYRTFSSGCGKNSFTWGVNEAFGLHVRALWALGWEIVSKAKL